MPGPPLENGKVKEISSPGNPRFKSLVRLLTTSGIQKQDAAIIAGKKSIKEILDEFPEHCQGVLFSGSRPPAFLIPRGIERICLSQELFKKLDVHGTHFPLLLTRTGPFPAWDPATPRKGCTLLVPFQDPANVGAVVRTAAAFGVSLVVVLKEASHPFHHKSARAAGSALFRVPLSMGPSIRDVPKGKTPLIGLSTKGQSIEDYQFPASFVLLPGMEGPGLPPGLPVDRELRIPMEPRNESLNAAMATGIALYEWRRSVQTRQSFS